MRALGLIILLFMAACAARHDLPQTQVTNPYQARAEALARSGVDALGREQWKRAQMLFGKSLQAATLADNASLISLVWYNLGRARAGDGNTSGAQAAYAQSIRQAGNAQDTVSRQRAYLALALLDGRNLAQSKESASDDLLRVPDSFPIDVHLAAARLACLRHKSELARHAYGRVLAKAGQDRSGLIYAARAHLGLARLLSADGGHDSAVDAQQHLERAFKLIYRAGEPRLILQALNLAAEMEADPARRAQWLQRAEAVQQALHKAHAE